MSGLEAYSHVLCRLDRTQQCTWGLKARCPAHDDRTASLSVRVSPEGHLWLKCHAGCAFTDIVRSIGIQPGECFAKDESKERAKMKEVASYDYRDEQGQLLFQVVRFDPKDFRQRHPKPGGGWNWGLNGTRRVLYRLPELVKDPNRVVMLVEGEKDADRLLSAGFLATCNPMGAGKWLKEYSDTLRGRRVVIIPDNDRPGEEHASTVRRALSGVAQQVAIVRLDGLTDKQDVSDWFDQGHTAEQLKALCRDVLRADVAEVVRLAAALDKPARIMAVQHILSGLQD